MGRTGDGRDQPAEQPSRFSAMKSRIRQHDIGKHRSKKKQRVSIRKTETESATVTLNHTSTSYTHSYANSYSYSYSRGKEKRHKGKAKRAIADDKRKWVYSTHDVSPNQDRVILMSYNILGVKNAAAHEDLYRNVSPKYLDWDYRKKLICKEIRDYNPDIMCFQEVDRFDDLDYLLQKEGFKGVYQARTGDASDGCAIFWNNKLPAGKSCSFCSSFLATSTEIENCLLLIVSISFLSNLCYFQFTNISGYRFDILHEESIEFQNFNLRNNVCQLCVFKMNVKSSTKDVSASNSDFSFSILVNMLWLLECLWLGVYPRQAFWLAIFMYSTTPIVETSNWDRLDSFLRVPRGYLMNGVIYQSCLLEI
nr:carbon catabolite repressor protein 4 homolog 5 isoform X3 [Solanum lycopersicum]